MGYLSAGVYTKEVALDNSVAAISTTGAAIAGRALKGSSDTQFITSPNDFLAEYGTPTLGSTFHYAALAYLKQGNRLYVKRAVDTSGDTMINAVDDTVDPVYSAGETTVTLDEAIVGTFSATDSIVFNITKNSMYYIASYSGSTIDIVGDVVAGFSLEDKLVLINAPVLDTFSGASIGDYTATTMGVSFATGTKTADSFLDINEESLFNIYAANQGSWGSTIKVRIENRNTGNDVDDYLTVSSFASGTRTVTVSSSDGISVGDKIVNQTKSTVWTVSSIPTNTTFIVTESVTSTSFETSDKIEPITDAGLFDIVVYDVNNNFIERWNVSRQSYVDGLNTQKFLETVINGNSDYIRVKNNDSVDVSPYIMPRNTDTDVYTTLGGGYETTATDWDAKIAALWTAPSDFCNTEITDFRICIEGGVGTATQSAMDTCAKSRKDCIALLDLPRSATDVSSMVAFRKGSEGFNIDSSYSALYANWVKQMDTWNAEYVYQAPSGEIAAALAFTGHNYEIWNAAAGDVRGVINAAGTEHTFSKGELDYLYENGINPIQNFGGSIVIWGQKTLLKKASRLDRINVRMVLIVVEKSLSAYLKGFLFESHTELVRFLAKAGADEFMDDLRSREAFQLTTDDPNGYLVVCDESNNPPVVVDRQEMHVDVFVKPISVIEYIQLRVTVTKTGVSFDELISRGAL